MKAKNKSVSDIERALKRSKRGIHQILPRIRNVASTGDYSLSQIKYEVGGEI